MKPLKRTAIIQLLEDRRDYYRRLVDARDDTPPSSREHWRGQVSELQYCLARLNEGRTPRCPHCGKKEGTENE